jgi:hypothetical protein
MQLVPQVADVTSEDYKAIETAMTKCSSGYPIMTRARQCGQDLGDRLAFDFAISRALW